MKKGRNKSPLKTHSSIIHRERYCFVIDIKNWTHISTHPAHHRALVHRLGTAALFLLFCSVAGDLWPLNGEVDSCRHGHRWLTGRPKQHILQHVKHVAIVLSLECVPTVFMNLPLQWVVVLNVFFLLFFLNNQCWWISERLIKAALKLNRLKLFFLFFLCICSPNASRTLRHV